MYKTGQGLLNSAINKLPFEAHLPGYQYCGPGTKLEKRLARGDPGINPLDAACKRHDIVYSKFRNGEERTEADRILSSEAWKRVLAKDAGAGERTAALLVTGVMKTKIGLSKLGKGLRKRTKSSKKLKRGTKLKKCSFKAMVSKAKKAIKVGRPTSADAIVNTALAAARDMKKNKIISQPRVIPIPKSGGILPLVPIFAGLSAIGSLAGGASAIYNAIKSTNNAKKKSGMGAIAVGKSIRGDGLYLRPYKKGYGLYFKPCQRISKNY